MVVFHVQLLTAALALANRALLEQRRAKQFDAAVAQFARGTSGVLIVDGDNVRGKAMFSSFASGKGAMRLMCQSIAKEFGPKGIHIAHFIIDGVINGDKVVKGFPEFAEKLGEEGMLNLDAIAQTYWSIHQQDKSAWTHEVDLRPNIEPF